MVEHYLKNLIEDVKKQNSGEPLDDEKVREHYMPLAERNVKWYAIRNKLIDHGGLEVSRDDLNAEIHILLQFSKTFYKVCLLKKSFENPTKNNHFVLIKA